MGEYFHTYVFYFNISELPEREITAPFTSSTLGILQVHNTELIEKAQKR
jgi:hypothetical protein